MNLLDDLNTFFADLGVPAIITPSGRPSWPLTVLFDLNSMDQMGCQTDKPQIIIQDSDLARINLTTDRITVVGKYPAAKMTKPDPDGAGLTTLLLTRQ